MKPSFSEQARPTHDDLPELSKVTSASAGGIWGDAGLQLTQLQTGYSQHRDPEDVVEGGKGTSKGSHAIIMACIAFSTGIASFLLGVVTIALPNMAKDVNLPDNLTLW